MVRSMKPAALVHMAAPESLSDIMEMLFGFVILLAILAAIIVYVKRNYKDPEWRRDTFRLVLGTAFVTVCLPIMLFITFDRFAGWMRLPALAVQIFVLVLVFYGFHWARYPGIFQSKTSARILFELLASTLLVLASPIYALLARLHLAGFLPLNRLAARLGFGFRHHRGEEVLVGPSAPAEFRPGVPGIVRRILVVSEGEISAAPLEPVGSVSYELEFAGGARLQVPERFLLGS
jgi:hypothetical protein